MSCLFFVHSWLVWSLALNSSTLLAVLYIQPQTVKENWIFALHTYKCFLLSMHSQTSTGLSDLLVWQSPKPCLKTMPNITSIDGTHQHRCRQTPPCPYTQPAQWRSPLPYSTTDATNINTYILHVYHVMTTSVCQN